jgi:hypothetical protein
MNEVTATTVPDAADLKRLHAAAAGLSPSGIWVALAAVGADPDRGLEGVTPAKLAVVEDALRSAFRVEVRELPTSQEVFDGASVEGIREHRAKVAAEYARVKRVGSGS